MSENNLPNIDGEENTTPAMEENTSETEENTSALEENISEPDGDASAEEAVYEENASDDIAAVEDEIFIKQEEAPVFDTEASSTADDIETPDITPPKKSGAGKVIAIVVVVVVILALIGVVVYKQLTRNPYNELGYINVSGRTIGEVAEQAGSTLEEFLADYGLPADMPADTEESAAYYSIPTNRIAEMYGMEVSELKELLGLGDDVTDDTPWGEAEGKAPLGKYIGEDYLEQFKEEYGLGDDITADTLWGEVRNIVDQKNLEQQEAAAASAQEQDADSYAVGDDDAGLDTDDDGSSEEENIDAE